MTTLKPQGNLLLDERPLVVLPALAVRFGLNEAIVLQQLHYWVSPTTGLSTNIIDGVKWAYNTYEEWQAQFPWWSVHTIQRIFTALERRGLVIARAMNVKDWDRRKWYTIDYAEYNRLISDVRCTVENPVASEDSKLASSKEENSSIEDSKLAPSNLSKLASSNLPKLEPSNSPQRHALNGTETTAKTTAENSSEITNDVVAALERAGLTHEQAMAAQRKYRLNRAEGELWATWKRGVTGSRNSDAVFAGLIRKQRLPPGAGVLPATSERSATRYQSTVEQADATVRVRLFDGSTSTRSLPHVWQAVIDELSVQLERNEVETWVRPSTLLTVDDDVAVIGTPNIFVRQELEQRYVGLLQEALAVELGRPVDVLVAIEPTPAHER